MTQAAELVPQQAENTPELALLGSVTSPVLPESAASETVPQVWAGEQATLPVSALVPYRNLGGLSAGQPREHFDAEELAALVQSIEANGFTSQLDVRAIGDGTFEVLAGHRRLRAAIAAGLDRVPCIIRQLDDHAARQFVLTDNLHRVDFLPWEEGQGFRELVQVHGLNLAEVARRTGKAAATVAARIKLAEGLGERGRELYIEKRLTLEALNLLAELPDRIMSPVQCPGCSTVNPEGSEACVACGRDFSLVFVCQLGNPQRVAADACRGLRGDQVNQVVERVRASYGLSAAPVQSCLGFGDVDLRAVTSDPVTKLEKGLDDLLKVAVWANDQGQATVGRYTKAQKARIIERIGWVRTALGQFEAQVS